MYQNSSTTNSNSKELNRNKYENTVYNNYSNSQINADANTVSSKIVDKIQVLNFTTMSKSMTLLIIK